MAMSMSGGVNVQDACCAYAPPLVKIHNILIDFLLLNALYVKPSGSYGYVSRSQAIRGESILMARGMV